jgi:transcriptional regulator with PAS, ATPase and Fis domain
MSMPAQAKLLRVLQEGVIEPLGTNESVRVDVRVISATNRNLKERVTEGLFREDLYYRLNVLNVDIPPLRERKGDLPLLVQYFLKKLGKSGRVSPRLSQAAWTALAQFAFPGNVRQLEHAIQHAVVLAGDSDIEIRAPDRASIAHAGDVVLAGITPDPPAGRAAAQVCSSRELPAACAVEGGACKRTAGGRDPGHLAQEPCGRSCACTASPDSGGSGA